MKNLDYQKISALSLPELEEAKRNLLESSSALRTRIQDLRFEITELERTCGHLKSLKKQCDHQIVSLKSEYKNQEEYKQKQQIISFQSKFFKCSQIILSEELYNSIIEAAKKHS